MRIPRGYDADGHRQTLTAGSVTTTYGYDADSQLTSLSFNNGALGQLGYNYDNDGRVTSETGSLASLNLQQSEGPNTYSSTNQIQTWNTHPAATDAASNITTDPAAGASLTWDSRNQLSSVTGGPASSFNASYDGILRRDSQTTPYGGTTTYVHNNKTVAQSSTTNAPTNPINNYLTVPGTGEVLAFTSTVGGTTSTYVPIQDGQGSTIGLVNSGNVLQTTFTYDPFGNPTAGGSATSYPFLFKGMEYDATGYYYGGGVYYSPALGRPLQQIDPGGSGGGGGGFNAAVPSAQGSGGGISAGTGAAEAGGAVAAGLAAGAATSAFGVGASDMLIGTFLGLAPTGVGLAVAAVVAAILGILDFFGIFGGGGSAPIIPNGYYRLAHYVPCGFIGCYSVTPNMQDSANQEAAGPASTGSAIIGETATVAFEGFEIGSGFVAVTVGALLIAAGAEALTHYIKGERNWEKARGDDPYWSMTPADLRKIENDPRSTPAQKERAKRIRKQKEHKGSR